MEYKVLKAEDIEGLEILVGGYLTLGWKCQGGVSITNEGYAQAMVK